MRKHLFNLFFIYSFVFLGCEDPLDSVVTKKDSNELFELTLQASNKIVNSENSIDVMARIKRLKDGNSDVSNKVLGVWDLIYDYPDTLDNKILEISYSFFDDKTVSKVETHHFDVVSLGSKILGEWLVTEINESGNIIDLSSSVNKYTFKNDSSLVFSKIDSISEGIDVGLFSTPFLIDIDKDADKDLFIGCQDGTIKFFQNTGTSLSPKYIFLENSDNPLNDIIVNGFATPTFVDIDNDNDFDLFVGQSDGNISFFQNTGSSTNPSFSELTGNNNPLNSINVGYNASANFFDFDGDDDMDLVIGAYNGEINFYQNIGSSESANFNLVNNSISSISVNAHSTPISVDIDKDEDIDIFLGSQDGVISFFQNQGDNTFIEKNGDENPLNIVDIGQNSFPFFTDIDSDGDMDLYIGEEDGNINYLVNIGSPESPSFIIDSENLGFTKSTSRNGGWNYNNSTKELEVAFNDILGGELETGIISFDGDSVRTPINAYMTWKTDNRDVIMQKIAHVDNFNVPEDSIVTVSGGWSWNLNDTTLSATINDIELSGSLKFDTQGSVVPLNGFMYWTTNQEGPLTLKKKSSVSSGSSSYMRLSLDATGGTLDIHHVTSTSIISVILPDSSNSTFKVEGLFVPRSSEKSGLISAKFQDLFVKMPITIVDR